MGNDISVFRVTNALPKGKIKVLGTTTVLKIKEKTTETNWQVNARGELGSKNTAEAEIGAEKKVTGKASS